MVSPKERNALTASKKLMQNYLSELLTEEIVEEPPAQISKKKTVEPEQKLDKLLRQASAVNDIDSSILESLTPIKSESSTDQVIGKQKVSEQFGAKAKQQVILERTELKTKKHQTNFNRCSEKSYRQGSFQAMFFDVAGLLIAVPLIELGGIHNVDKTTALMGKPDWFKGVMIHRHDKINVVDTARWVMPEKYTQAMHQALNYQYVIMLNNSMWGLMAENLIDTVTLDQDDIKWMPYSIKRPWLAGLVKERTCALLDVESLIEMLDDGANIHPGKN